MLLQIQISTPNRIIAENVAERLVQNQLAACVQILGPMLSVYSWKKKLEKDEEYLCLIKTTASRYDEVEKAILELHPYEVPEIIAIEIDKGNKDYLQWIKDALE